MPALPATIEECQAFGEALAELAEAATMADGERETPRLIDKGDGADNGWMTQRGEARLVTLDGIDYLLHVQVVQ